MKMNENNRRSYHIKTGIQFISKKNSKQIMAKDPIDLTGFGLFAMAIILLSILFNNYLNSSTYPLVSKNSLIYLIEGSIAIAVIFMVMLYNHNHKLIANKINFFGSKKMKKEQWWLWLLCIISFISIQLLFSYLQNIKLFGSVAIDVYSFFISGAIIEEFIYRIAAIFLLQMLLIKIFKMNLKIANILIIFLSAAIFMIAHTDYYGNIYNMLFIFCGGVSQAFFYMKIKNITPCILAHATVNIIAAASLLMTLS